MYSYNSCVINVQFYNDLNEVHNSKLFGIDQMDCTNVVHSIHTLLLKQEYVVGFFFIIIQNNIIFLNINYF